MLKKVILCCLLIAATLLAMPSTTSAFLGDTHVVVDGKPLSGSAIIKKGVTFVPFRELFNELGLEIGYTAKTKQVTGTKDDLKISFTVGSKTCTINGQKKSLQAAPFIDEGSVYVPIRIVGESTGSLVKYLKDVQVVLVNSPEFKGLTYDCPLGSLNITADGQMSVDNLMVLDRFLSFSQEEEVVTEIELSNGDNNNTTVTLTPDTKFETVPSNP